MKPQTIADAMFAVLLGIAGAALTLHGLLS